MTKLNINDKMPNFNVDTIYERGKSLNDLLGENKTGLMVLRYEGCTSCRFDMMILKEEYDKITTIGGKVIVVLQSDANKLEKEIEKDHFPFLVICDPKQEIYKELDIRVASSMEELIGTNAEEKFAKVKASGLQHGDYEGEELQLPAFFVLDKDMNVLHSHYANSLTDMPDVEAVVELLK